MCASETVLWAAVLAMAARTLTSRCPASAQNLLWCCSTSGHSFLIGCLCLPQHKNISKVDYAMQSLKRAMKWDEVTAQLLTMGFLMCQPACNLALLVALHCTFIRNVRSSLMLLKHRQSSQHVQVCSALAAPAPICALQDVFGLEYDLDLFNIVAVDDFNMGAMVRAAGQLGTCCRRRLTCRPHIVCGSVSRSNFQHACTSLGRTGMVAPSHKPAQQLAVHIQSS